MRGSRWGGALLAASAILIAACTSGGDPVDSAAPQTPQTTSSTSPRPTTVELTTTAPARTALPTTAASEETFRTGSQVLYEEGFARLSGKRVGLIAHGASVVDDNRLADLLHADPDVQLVALFAPEHGLFGLADAGEPVGDELDPATEVPVYSLYGSTRSPTPQSLQGLDVLLYDLQDVGARFYTYISTMGLAMEAANQAGVQFMVMDRPNPLGGDTRQGATLAAGLESFIGKYRIPSAYGLTAGELAQMIVGDSLLPGVAGLDLTVVPMTGWNRTDRWQDLDLEWIPPSPNLRSADAALLYPGTVLFEATSLSEGRGTSTPFRLIGAEWINGLQLAAGLQALELPGVTFDEAIFELDDGIRREGVLIEVEEPHLVSGFEVGLRVLAAVLEQAEETGRTFQQVVDRPKVFDRLAGTPDVRIGLEAGQSVAEILAAVEADHGLFANKVEPYLLYD